MQKHNSIRPHLKWLAFYFHHHPLNDFVELIKLSTTVELDQINRATKKEQHRSRDKHEK